MGKILLLLAALLCTNFYYLNAQQIDLSIRFDKNSDVVNSVFIDQLKLWMSSNYHYRNDLIELRGHTDSDSDDDFNKALSERRNLAVIGLLKTGGFSNIKSSAFGETNPLCSSEDEICKSKNRRVEILLYNTFDEKFLLDNKKVVAQSFLVNTDEGDIVEGKQGTKIYIPAESFTKPDNTPVNGNVRLELSEFYSMKDFYENKLTTTSNGKLLESGGTIFIQAYDDDGLVELASNKSLSVVFDSQKKGLEPGMQAFYGKIENNNINWILEPLNNKTQKENLNRNQNNQFGYLGEWQIDLDWKYTKLRSFRETLVAFDQIPMDEMTEDEKILRLSFYDRNWHHNEELLAQFSPEKQKEIKEMQLEAPENEKKYFEFLEKSRIEYEKKLSEKRRIQKEKLDKEKLEYRQNIKNNNLNFNLDGMLKVNQIGWINCDRFYTSTNINIASMKVIIENKEEVEIVMIIPSVRGTLKGTKTSNNEFEFNNFPKYAEILLICNGRQIGTNKSIFEFVRVLPANEIRLSPNEYSHEDRDKKLALLD